MKGFLDKIVMKSRNELVLIFTHRPPVSISGDDPLALYLFLQTPSQLTYPEFKAGVSNDLEITKVA